MEWKIRLILQSLSMSVKEIDCRPRLWPSRDMRNGSVPLVKGNDQAVRSLGTMMIMELVI
jgi:hypothetical protein